jgi:transposase
LPEKYPHPSTCWRRLRDWEEQGVWLNIWRAFLSELNERQQLKCSESFLDGSFAPAKKGAPEWEKPSGARGRSGWWWSTARVFLCETSFTLHPRRHHAGRPRQKPVRVITDKAYDSDPLRDRLRRRGIELISPHKSNRVRPATQDGRALRRYRRRWILERTIGWLGNFRRLVVRYDRSLAIYRAFFHIACFMIV